MSEKHILCVVCRSTFSDEEIEGKYACPQCGGKGVPADTNEKATLTLTHHEWRTLFMWADRWATDVCKKSDQPGHDSPAVIAALVREAKRQCPTLPSLTLFGDVQEAVTALGTRGELHTGGDVTIIEPEKKH